MIWIALAGVAVVYQGWGLPETWPSDEVTQLTSEMVVRRSLNPRYFYYPSLMFDACYLPCRALTVLGLLNSRNITEVGHLCRSVSATCFLLTVLLLSKTVRTLLGRSAEPTAILFTGTMGALVHHAHLATVNSCFLATIALALYQLVRTLKHGTEKEYYKAVAACGLACGAKYNALFLFGSLPVLWLMVFGIRSLTGIRFWRCFVLSLLLAAGVFLLTTPYALLDRPTFTHDFHELCAVEGPAFRSVFGPIDFGRRFLVSSFGIFSPVTFGVLMSFLAAVYAGWLWQHVRPQTRGVFWQANQVVLQASGLLAVTLVGYLLMTYRIGIGQTRYFLPAALLVSLLFLLALSWVRNQYGARRWVGRLPGIFLCTLLVPNVLNCYAHVVVFPESPKSRALQMMQEAVRNDPGSTVGVINYGWRSPFQLSALAKAPHVFNTQDAPDPSVHTWNQYLEVIARDLEKAAPRYVVLEDIITLWPVFLPRQYQLDYGKRLDYPNPGPDAWEAMLGRIGYTRVAVLRQGEGRAEHLLQQVLGHYYLLTAEGALGQVYVYERSYPHDNSQRGDGTSTLSAQQGQPTRGNR
jgi:hypothetical protein